MLQLQVIRQNPEWVKERLAVKNFTETELLDKILGLDEQRKKLQFEFENIQAKINSSSKEIGAIDGKRNKDNAESLNKMYQNKKFLFNQSMMN